MKPSQAIRYAKLCVLANESFCFVGAPGVGKSAACRVVANLLDYDFKLSQPAVEDPTDAKGLPHKVGKHAEFMPFGVVHEVLSSKKPTLWCLEDLGQANKAMQSAYMPWLGERRMGQHVLPDHVRICANTNRRDDNANVSGMLDPVKTRFGALIPFEADANDWVDWYVTTGLPGEFAAYIRARPSMLVTESSGQQILNYANPRTWEKAARLYKSMIENEGSLPDSRGVAQYLALAVGEGAATDFASFLPYLKQVPDIDEVFNHPATVPLPDRDNPTLISAVATMIASHAKDTKEHHESLVELAQRMMDIYGHEFPVLLIRDATRRLEKFCSSESFNNLIQGPLGKEIAKL